MKRPWFSDPGIGTLFLVPITLSGWLSLVMFIAVIAMSATTHQNWAWAFRVAVAVAFLGFSYYKSDRWDPRWTWDKNALHFDCRAAGKPSCVASCMRTKLSSFL